MAGRFLTAALVFVSRNRYVFLSLLIILLMISHLSNKRWEGDFWEHAAVVRELATHPLSPHHPMLLADTPHTFYTPYTLFVGLFSRATTLGPISSLAIAGIINLILLLISLRVFISSLVKENAEKTAFYTVLFMLFLWGRPPWFWSGFLHLEALGYVLPYPSTFSAALMFFSFAIYLHILKGARLECFIPLFLIIPTALLIHPTTALVLYAGLIAFTIGSRKTVTRDMLLLLAGVFTLSIAVALLHPYYSFMDLFLVKSRAFHEDSYDLYESIVPRIMPSLIGVVPLLARLKKNWVDPLVLFFILLACVYAYGALSGSSGYGRVIFYIVFLLQLVLGMWATHAEIHKNWRGCTLLLAYLYIAAPLLPTYSLSSILKYKPGQDSTYSNLEFISRYTKQYDVILADIDTSCVVPALGGKVVAYNRYVYWLEDDVTRKHNVNYFLSDTASEIDRVRILRRYRVNYILVNMARTGPVQCDLESYLPFGDVVYRSPYYCLIKIDERKPIFIPRQKFSVFRLCGDALKTWYEILLRRPCSFILHAVTRR